MWQRVYDTITSLPGLFKSPSLTVYSAIPSTPPHLLPSSPLTHSHVRFQCASWPVPPRRRYISHQVIVPVNNNINNNHGWHHLSVKTTQRLLQRRCSNYNELHLRWRAATAAERREGSPLVTSGLSEIWPGCFHSQNDRVKLGFNQSWRRNNC